MAKRFLLWNEIFENKGENCRPLSFLCSLKRFCCKSLCSLKPWNCQGNGRRTVFTGNFLFSFPEGLFFFPCGRWRESLTASGSVAAAIDVDGASVRRLNNSHRHQRQCGEHHSPPPRTARALRVNNHRRTRQQNVPVQMSTQDTFTFPVNGHMWVISIKFRVYKKVLNFAHFKFRAGVFRISNK